VAWQAPAHRGPSVVTAHDVVPRTPALRPLQRMWIDPRVLRQADRVIAHSAFAAGLLTGGAGVRADRVVVIRHPAPRPADPDRIRARQRLGWPADALIAVLPGVIKPAKMTREAVAAAGPLLRSARFRLVLAGPVADRAAAEAARAAGASVLEAPDDLEYELAVCAADVVLVLRAGSVGETNGPLLDAMGAGRAILATATGSIPEVAGEAARYCAPDVGAIARGLALLADPGERAERERLARERAALLTWSASASAHAAVFEEVFARA
jgi:glycosyltransferase involved in cell wall biosynthesis